MKVLISGGLLSDNVVNGIANRFSSGGIDFLVVPFIDDIDDIYQRGEYFDKAIILANSWNHDFEDTNILSIKKRVSDFVTSVTKRKLSNVEIIFVAEDDDEASVIYEEILLIMNISTLVVKAPRYTVKFFSMLITTEKDKLPSDMVYEKYINNKIDTDKDIDMSSEKSDTLEEAEEKEDIKAEEKPIILDSDDIENDFELSEDDTEEPGTIEIDEQSLFDEYPGDMSVEDYEVDIDEFEETKVADNKENEKVILIKPQTFMNNSGESVVEFVRFYKEDISKVMIIYDDMDTEVGQIRVRAKGGPGSHNGMKSMVNLLNSEEFPRIRVGIGRPKNEFDRIDYVIGNIPDSEYVELQKGQLLAVEAVEYWIKNGIDNAMNKFNIKKD